MNACFTGTLQTCPPLWVTLVQLVVSRAKIFTLLQQLQICRSVWVHPTDTTMAAVILLTVTPRASPLPILLLSPQLTGISRNLTLTGPNCFEKPRILLKGVFDLAAERTSFISRHLAPFSSAFSWSLDADRLRWHTQIRAGMFALIKRSRDIFEGRPGC